jgi:hypothetical protein
MGRFAPSVLPALISSSMDGQTIDTLLQERIRQLVEIERAKSRVVTGEKLCDSLA